MMMIMMMMMTTMMMMMINDYDDDTDDEDDGNDDDDDDDDDDDNDDDDDANDDDDDNSPQYRHQYSQSVKEKPCGAKQTPRIIHRSRPASLFRRVNRNCCEYSDEYSTRDEYSTVMSTVQG
jgi:ABC-type Zn2+ transport system substrate-binding protein/surface adhesin